MERYVLAVAAVMLMATLGAAQHRHGPAAPYAGLETRAIKALSEQQVSDLEGGRGMGLALAAELNGYPGPMHVLEFADRLALTQEQRAKVEALFAAMKAEAVPLGRRLIEEEAKLDRLFAERTVTPVSLSAATDAIGATQAALRRAHLSYHLETEALMTPEQVRRYAELRGYHGQGHGSGHGHGGGAR